MLRLLLKAAATTVAAVAWAEFLWKPVEFYARRPDVGKLDVVGELLKPSNDIYSPMFLGWLFILLTVTLAAIALLIGLQVLGAMLAYVKAAEVGISVLETRLRLTFEDDQLSLSTLTRDQLFHANQNDTAAYQFEHSTTSPEGTLITGSYNVESMIDQVPITDNILSRETNKYIEIIEIFKKPLPTSWWATYLPDSAVLFLYRSTRFLHRVIVVRHSTISNRNEYNGEHPIFQLTSVRYPASNVHLEIDFPRDVAPSSQDVKCFRIRANAVETIHASCQERDHRRIFTVYVRDLFKESLRIQWNNKNLVRQPLTAA